MTRCRRGSEAASTTHFIRQTARSVTVWSFVMSVRSTRQSSLVHSAILISRGGQAVTPVQSASRSSICVFCRPSPFRSPLYPSFVISSATYPPPDRARPTDLHGHQYRQRPAAPRFAGELTDLALSGHGNWLCGSRRGGSLLWFTAARSFGSQRFIRMGRGGYGPVLDLCGDDRSWSV